MQNITNKRTKLSSVRMISDRDPFVGAFDSITLTLCVKLNARCIARCMIYCKFVDIIIYLLRAGFRKSSIKQK